jgi:TolB protein
MLSAKRLSSIRHAQFYCLGALLLLFTAPFALRAQVIQTETSKGATVRIAVADFKPGSSDPQTGSLKTTFDSTLFADLANAGIFDIVSKSLLPQSIPGAPAEINIQQWAAPPAAAAMVAFGSFGVEGGRITCNGFLFDAKNQQYPQVLAKQYNEEASDDSARSPIASPTRSSSVSAEAPQASPNPKSSTLKSPEPTKISGRWTTTVPTSMQSPT